MCFGMLLSFHFFQSPILDLWRMLGSTVLQMRRPAFARLPWAISEGNIKLKEARKPVISVNRP